MHFVEIFDRDDTLLWSGGIFPPHDFDDEPYEYSEEDKIAEIEAFLASQENPEGFVLSEERNQSPIDEASAEDPRASQDYLLFPPVNACYILDQPPQLSFTNLFLKEGTTYLRDLDQAEFAQLAQMYQERCGWEGIHALIRRTYGETACQVMIDSYQEYNDESGYYVLLNLAGVSDCHGSALEPDPSLPIWQTRQMILDWLPQHEDVVEYTWPDLSYYRADGQYVENWSGSARHVIHAILSKLVGLEEKTYDLNAPPPVPPEIYATVEIHQA